jgi:hypothetical protein
MEKQIAYVTQYALTAGIRCCEVVRADKDGYGWVKWPGAIGGSAMFGKNHWHSDPAEAVKAAEEMRAKKIASLQKQIAKLEKLTFKLPEGRS